VKVPAQVSETGRLGFGDLKIRPKLIVLHNLFFLVLASAVYFSLIPLVDGRLEQARLREANLVVPLLAGERQGGGSADLAIYQYRSGSAEELAIPPDLRARLDAEPGRVQLDPGDRGAVYLKDPATGDYRGMRLPDEFYSDIVRQSRWVLFFVLAGVYIAAVLLLELLIMPRYVYRPILAIMSADEASRRGRREEEFVPESLIPGDEIGQIMRSRNATVAELRRHEDEAEEALARLEDLNSDLTRKNYLLETAKRNIADQDRLASLGLLIASVAHEINTPLAVLHGSIEKLSETVRGEPAQTRLSRMLRVTRRLQRLSESLLDFSRARKLEVKDVSVREVVEESWALVSIDEKALQVTFEDLAPPEAQVVGNPDRLVQLFVNLLRNALHAAPDGGRVRVLVDDLQEPDRSWLVVSVEDNGPGIPTDSLPNIFEAFVTTRLDARGTGLGLTVAEGIVTEHGGSISASNLPDGGACLQVRLPAAVAAAQDAKRTLVT
jgi:signal transduction histidine kinase